MLIKVTGEVKSLSHRRFAEVLLWWVPGSCDVYNRLHVRPPQVDSDEEITDVVRMVFDKEPALDAEQISVVTRDSEVTLRGAVATETQKLRAVRDVWYIPGVHAVHDGLEVLSR
ncbi:MAG: BON domain-containing protein [Gammaproteobacteria bacterium]|nr:BON domain-containing protein [Gammaproteobacteria bacterium]